MDADKIITIISVILTVAIFAWGLYSKVKGNAAEAVSGLIAAAEETDLLGKEKMALVVGWLFDMIPTPFKKVLSKEFLEKLAQKIFDYMKKYAIAYIDSKSGKGKDAYIEVNDEVIAELSKNLAGIGSAGLKILADEMNIDTTDKSNAEIIQAIIAMLIAKNKNIG